MHSREQERRYYRRRRLDEDQRPPEAEPHPSIGRIMWACLRGFWAGSGFLGLFGLAVLLFVIHTIWGSEGLFWFVAAVVVWGTIRFRVLLRRGRERNCY